MVYGASESWSSSVSEGEGGGGRREKRKERDNDSRRGGIFARVFWSWGALALLAFWAVGRRSHNGLGGRPLPPGSSCGSWGKEAASASSALASSALAAVIIIFLMFMIPGGVKRERERSGPGLAWENRWG